jgi:two-component SAPR family response regulator
MDDHDRDVMALAQIQGDIAVARQLATQVDDVVRRERLLRWAEAVEQQARELDADLLTMLNQSHQSSDEATDAQQIVSSLTI